MTKTLLSGLLALAVIGGSAPLGADVLILDEVRQVEKMDLPKNGLSKAEVEARFGEPSQRHAAVGEPPISRWDYGDYSVYFEYDLVLYSVLTSGQVIEEA